jgi:hypothetical protein
MQIISYFYIYIYKRKAMMRQKSICRYIDIYTMVLIKECDSIKDTIQTHVYLYVYYRKNRRHLCSTSFILTEPVNQ